jgi:hypothetical protein
MVEGRCANEKIKITDHFSCNTKPASLTAEDATDILIDTNHGDTTKKIIEGTLVRIGISGIGNPLVEFREGNDGEREPYSLEFFQTLDDGRIAI